MVSHGLFGDVREFPDPEAGDRFAALIGIDDIKARLVLEAQVLLDPTILIRWSNDNHGEVLKAVRSIDQRAPLIVLGGDVGTGKTELAETVGHPIASDLKVNVTLYPLSLSARGKGLVGEMTTLLTEAFATVYNAVANARDNEGRLHHAAILLVDEADALAQSRDLGQMHHEDRAGVNALIRGIDGFRRDRQPVLTIMCTNRPDAIDPAIARRAAHIFTFSRPDDAQRGLVVESEFRGVTMTETELKSLVHLLGPDDQRRYGATYSDLRQRFVPDAMLDAVRHRRPITAERLIELAKAFEPSRPFGQGHPT